jgi:hypothetical protein
MTATYDLANDLGGDMPEKEAKTGGSAFARWRERRREKRERTLERQRHRSEHQRNLERAGKVGRKSVGQGGL